VYFEYICSTFAGCLLDRVNGALVQYIYGRCSGGHVGLGLPCTFRLRDRVEMNRCRLALRGRSSSQPTTTFMPPSSIHHLHAELAVAELCSDISHAVAKASSVSSGVAELVASAACSGDVARLPTLRVQAVEKDGCWFALDSAQLELCRRLERGGVCRQVHRLNQVI